VKRAYLLSGQESVQEHYRKFEENTKKNRTHLRMLAESNGTLLLLLLLLFYYKIVHVVQNNEKNTRDNQK